MTDYDRPEETYGREIPRQEPDDELVAGRRDEAPDDEPIPAPADRAYKAEEEPTPAAETPEGATGETFGPEGKHASTPAGDETFEPVFGNERADDVRQRWHDVQASFVDDPHDAIARAGKLTDEVLSTLSSGLENRRRVLEQSASEGDTERLRMALRQYRLMLDRVLTL